MRHRIAYPISGNQRQWFSRHWCRDMLPLSFICSALLFGSAQRAIAADKPANPIKQTPYGLYLTASEAHTLKQTEGPQILFVDIRTPAEVMFVGIADSVDAHVPFETIDYSRWDTKKKAYTSQRNQNFVMQLEQRLTAEMTKATPIILICRSGKRSAKASKLLKTAGYKTVYTVIDGFEGDKAKSGPQQGKRTVNGWKNADLPWSYRLKREKVMVVAQ